MPPENHAPTIGEVVSLVRGTTYKSALLGQPGPVLLGLASIQRNGGFRDDSLKTYGGESKPNQLLVPGDLFVSLKDVTQSADLLGAVACVPPSVTSGRLTQDTVKLNFGNSTYPRRLVYWALRTPQYRAYCRGHSTGTTNLGLPREDFLAYRLPRPTGEALSLVETLEALDDRIDNLRLTNATLEGIAAALFKSWFVDFDGTGAEDMQESELGSIPKGWRVGALSDVAVHPRRSVQPEEIQAATPYIALEHMPRRSITVSDWGVAAGIESNKYAFKRGEVLFGKLRPYFHKVGIAPLDGICSTDIVVITPKSPAWFGFVLGHASSREFVEYTNAGATGTKMPRTSWYEMSRYAVVLPPEPIATAFNLQIQSMADKIISNIHESRTLAELRDTLLPRLISSQVVVSQ